jgi:phage terminase large subunit GpA-like protein
MITAGRASLERHRRFYAPRSHTRTLDWCRAHARNTDGRPYSHDAYPHIGAPGGPADAFDDPKTRRIWLQWGSRLGKTFLGQCATMKRADEQPCPMLFVSSVEKVASEVIERTYKMLVNSPRVAVQLRPEARRRMSCIDFDACQMFVGWARSVSTLADKEVEFGHANEIDKWEHQTTSKEADPLKLYLDRFKNRPHHKVLLESTPTIKGKSRIETGRLGSTNCQFQVPCPHCGEYQQLVLENLHWDHLPNGKSDKDLARRTTRYECPKCKGVIVDHHRPAMLKAGVWCPEGCSVVAAEARKAARGEYSWDGWDSAAWITGHPLRNGPEAGYQLSSLYALTLAWGDIAAEFVACKNRPQELRNFKNSWLAETWETAHRKCTWEELAQRIIVDKQQGVIPRGYSFLTAGIDRQADKFVYIVEAWGEGRKSHVVDYGECPGFEELHQHVIKRLFPHEDKGQGLQTELALIDTGYHPKDIYTFCKKCCQDGRVTWPCKGSNTALNAPYRQSKLGDDTLAPGAPIMHVDTLTTQDWISHQLMLDHFKDEGAATLFQGSLWDHQDFLEQLLNDAAVIKLGTNNVDREVWERIDENIPNDYRDCKRYSYAAMLRVTRGAPIKPRK